MTEREEQIIDAMLAVILRFGYSRMTMNDVAREAGLSRQSVYLCFRTKADLLNAATDLIAERTLAGIREGLAAQEDLSTRLDIIFHAIAVHSYEQMQKSVDATDIVNGFNDVAGDALRRAETAYTAIIAEVLTPYEAWLKANGQEIGRFSDYILQSLMAFKHIPKDRAHLDQLLSSLRGSVLLACAAG